MASRLPLAGRSAASEISRSLMKSFREYQSQRLALMAEPVAVCDATVAACSSSELLAGSLTVTQLTFAVHRLVETPFVPQYCPR